MCLYPKLIKNKKYLSNKKNNWNPPKCEDYRVLYVTAACGKCLECRKQKQREWLVRMSEELRHDPNAYFMNKQGIFDSLLLKLMQSFSPGITNPKFQFFDKKKNEEFLETPWYKRGLQDKNGNDLK